MMFSDRYLSQSYIMIVLNILFMNSHEFINKEMLIFAFQISLNIYQK